MSRRAAGLLVHPTSLPTNAGGVDAAAREVAPWMRAAQLSVWQILPLGPPDEGGSPYAAQSAFAGDPSWFPESEPAPASAIGTFVDEQGAWLADWAHYAALKEASAGLPWFGWDEAVRRRDPAALARSAHELRHRIDAHVRAQHRFMTRWAGLRTHLNASGISILGDVPIYPALDSADVWAHQELFHLDADGAPTMVAGVPPDYFSRTGQLWGNPLYRWDRLRATGFSWWVDRLRHALRLHDTLRLDHFRGFIGYWAVPADAETAEDGHWEPGPGAALFAALQGVLGTLPFVAEDLGIITEEVTALRKALELPGMRVLQFGFDGDGGVHAPASLPSDVVVYTGTHDNDTTRGWFQSLAPGQRARVLAAVGGTSEDVSARLVRAAYASAADLAVTPLQDVLDLGSEARMNVPGVAAGNWRWRASSGALTQERARALASLAEETGRGC